MYNAVKMTPNSFPDLIQAIADAGSPIAWFADIYLNKQPSTVFYLVHNYVEKHPVWEAMNEYVVLSNNETNTPRPWTVITQELLVARPDEFVEADKL